MQALISHPPLMAGRAALTRFWVAAHRSQRLTLTRQQFEAWLRQAVPGDRVIYHQGYLAVDRVRGSGGLSEPDRRELVALAKAALILAERGEIHLVQRRVEPSSFSYLAVKAWPTPALDERDQPGVGPVTSNVRSGPRELAAGKRVAPLSAARS